MAATARLLDRRFARARIRSYHLDPDRRRLAMYLRDHTLVWELHPERMGFRVLPTLEPPPEATPLPARVERVWAPPDDRVVVLDWRRIRGRPATGSLVVEFLPNQENVVATEGPERTVRALLRTRDGPREIRRGRPYSLPPSSRRGGIEHDPGAGWWEDLLAEAPAGEERRRLLRDVAWTSPLVIPSLLQEGGYALWQRIRARATWDEATEEEAAVVMGRHGPQPYPVPLPDRTLAPAANLLEAFGAVAEMEGVPSDPGTLLPGFLVEALEGEVERARARVARLQEELAGLPDAEERQQWGDLLLARFHLVPEGRDSVELEGFDGTPIVIPLDPALSPDANARRHYDRAARIRRARTGLPGRIRTAEARWRELDEILARTGEGRASRTEVESVLPRNVGSRGRAAAADPLPYRRFRSSGGLEIRVGRGAARNDDLTFRHSSPDDVWLHARHAAGAHVILRWTGQGSPPPADLREAAVLAALHSRARTSGSVPVDWTRRKWVRKPRKAPPGAVLPERVKTVFVEPSEALAERLRVD